MCHAARGWLAGIVTAGWVRVSRFGLAADGVSGCGLFGLAGKMGSFGIFWIWAAMGPAGGWGDESFIPASL